MPTALEIIENEVEDAQSTIIDVTVDELAHNLDELPVVGLGLSLFSSSIEKAMIEKVQQEIVPELEEHTEQHLEHVQAVIESDNTQTVHSDFEDALLETNPMWTMLDADDATRHEVRQKIVDHSNTSARLLADWAEQVGDATFTDYVELAEHLDESGEEMADQLADLLYYVDLLEAYREHLDPGVYSSVLDHPKVKAWFLTHLLAGLNKGREQVLDSVTAEIENG